MIIMTTQIKFNSTEEELMNNWLNSIQREFRCILPEDFQLDIQKLIEIKMDECPLDYARVKDKLIRHEIELVLTGVLNEATYEACKAKIPRR